VCFLPDLTPAGFTAAGRQWRLVEVDAHGRSMSGIRPYVRASCNPDADSWVAEFISWWIDPATGFAIPERAGVLR
jgi:hypothetical protein